MKVVKIFGCPGAGKTTELLRRLQDDVTRGADVGFVSFSRAAAFEAHRRYKIGGKASSKWFCTMHGQALRIMRERDRQWHPKVMGPKDLREFGKESGLRFEGWRVGEDDDAAGDNGTPLLTAIGLADALGVSLEEAAAKLAAYPIVTPERVRSLNEQLETFKTKHKLIDFNDMLRRYMATPHPLPVDALFVDECQDLTPQEWSMVPLFGRNAETVVLGGDDDQTIYPFRGASAEAFLDFPCDEEIVLNVSHRCPKAIGDYAESIICRVSRRKEKGIVWQDRPGVVERRNVIDFDALRATTGTVLLLCRHRSQVRELSRDLAEMGVVHSRHGESLATSPRSMAAATFLRLQDGETVAIDDAMTAASYFKNAKAVLPPLGMLQRDGVTCVAKRDVRGVDWTRHFCLVFTPDAENDAAASFIDRYGLDAIGKAPLVDVSTFHGSKGREADHVVVMTDCYEAVWDEQLRGMDNELRLAFVAVTRAKERLTILSPSSNMHLKAFD